MDRATGEGHQRKIGFPAQSIVEGEFWVYLPGVGGIQSDVLASLVHRSGSAGIVGSIVTHQVIRQPQSSRCAREGMGFVICGRIRIVGPYRALCAERQLVIAAQDADVIVGSEDSASSRTSERVRAEASGYRYSRRMG